MNQEPRSFIPTSEDREVNLEKVWAIVLAAGEGTRLASVTKHLCGRETPKQFVAFDGTRTLLQRTMDRLQPVVPPNRTVVVVARERREIAEAQLAGYPGVEIVSQPKNVGTGPGVLLPLCHVRARDPRATVIVTPSDHDIPGTEALTAALRSAVCVAAHAPAGLALVGATADSAATDLGWIMAESESAAQSRPAQIEDAPKLIARFVEKPPAAVARQLFSEGGLWNTLIVAGSVESFWHQAELHMPAQTALFRRYVDILSTAGRNAPAPRPDVVLAGLYRDMPTADFSRTILEKARGLAVVRLHNAGWCDCGTPERLLASLLRTPPGPARTSRQFVETVLRCLRADRDIAVTS